MTLKQSVEFYKDCRDRSQLPDDVDTLKDIIVYQWEVIDGLQKEFQDYRQKTDLLISQLMQKIENLEQEVSTLRRNRFGQRSEKGKTSSSSSSSKEDDPSSKTCANQNHPGRNSLPNHLERVPIEHDLKAEDKVCPECQSLLTRIKDITTEQLDLITSQIIVKQHVRRRYTCRHCHSTIKVAEMPCQPIDKGLASAELLAHLIVDKYDYYLPCYRLERWFAREGVTLSRSTMWGWFLKCYHLLKPLVDFMHQHEIVKGDHVFSDDTTMPTLEPGAGKTKTGRMWVYTKKATKNHKGVTVYQYTPSREGKYPVEFLKDFKGYVQADAYSGFNGLFVKDEEGQLIRKELGCWAHVRRKFFEIAKAYPNSLAQEMVDMINQLYAIEKEATLANLCDAARRGLRKRKSKPILKKIYRWLNYHQPKVVPKSPLGQAIAYSLNNWRALGTFLADGKLEIDNNRSERKIKPIVIGRKNHMFVGSELGGKAAAVFYSLIETCRDNDVNPEIYLADVLKRIPTHPNKRIHELLPYEWIKLREQPVAEAA
jgi:transposase